MVHDLVQIKPKSQRGSQNQFWLSIILRNLTRTKRYKSRQIYFNTFLQSGRATVMESGLNWGFKAACSASEPSDRPRTWKQCDNHGRLMLENTLHCFFGETTLADRLKRHLMLMKLQDLSDKLQDIRLDSFLIRFNFGRAPHQAMPPMFGWQGPTASVPAHWLGVEVGRQMQPPPEAVLWEVTLIATY